MMAPKEDSFLLRRFSATCLAVLALASCGGSEPSRPEGGAAPPRRVVVARMLPLPFDGSSSTIPAKPIPAVAKVLTVRERDYPVATLPSTTTEIVWPVDLPPRARLRFGFAAKSVGAADAGSIRFNVTLRQGSEIIPLFAAVRTPTSSIRRFNEAELDVSAHRGRAEIVFSSTPEAGAAGEGPARAVVYWADPLLLGAPPDSRRRLRKNLVLICVDTLRADRLRANGASRAFMPNMDRRLESAAVFTHAYANAPWSLPSIATILTGRVPSDHNAGRRTRIGESNKAVDYKPEVTPGGIELVLDSTVYRFQMLHPSIPTLQELLGAQGYYTGAIYHNGYINTPTRVLKGTDFVLHYSNRDAAVGTDEALNWMAENQDLNFFLFLHYIDVHQYPKDLRKELNTKPVEDLTPSEREEVVAAYDHLVAHVDGQLERLFKQLQETELWDETVFVFVADHGERFFEGGKRGSHGGSFHEPVIRVPLAVWGPGIKGARIRSRVSLADVVPTVLDLLAVPGDTKFSGVSFSKEIGGDREPDRRVFSEFVLWSQDQYAVLDQNWKYILYPGDPSRDELHNIAEDPREAINRIEDSPEIAARLRSILTEHIRNGQSEFSKLNYGETALDADTLESLRALGYVQ
jgi:arylsulfatase A-like enzyme